jgi:hypothetical protein
VRVAFKTPLKEKKTNRLIGWSRDTFDFPHAIFYGERKVTAQFIASNLNGHPNEGANIRVDGSLIDGEAFDRPAKLHHGSELFRVERGLSARTEIG